DPSVARAAEFLRQSVAGSTSTYEFASMLLFFDRLGNPQDKPLLAMLAANLMAGQLPNGGLSYNLPVPQGVDDTRAFLAALALTRPRSNLELFVADGRPSAKLLGVKAELVPDIKYDPDEPFRAAALPALLAKMSEPFRTAPCLTPPSRLN